MPGSIRSHKSLFTGDYESFLRLLRRVRLEAGMTQTELGQCIGQSQSFISKCERGERRVDVVELRAFCKAFGIDLEQFSRLLEAGLANSQYVDPSN